MVRVNSQIGLAGNGNDNMMVWIEKNNHGNILTGYQAHSLGLKKTVRITELDGEWLVDIKGDSHSIPAPEGNVQNFIDTMLGLNKKAIEIDNSTPAMIFKGKKFSFDCYIGEDETSG